MDSASAVCKHVSGRRPHSPGPGGGGRRFPGPAAARRPARTARSPAARTGCPPASPPPGGAPRPAGRGTPAPAAAAAQQGGGARVSRPRRGSVGTVMAHCKCKRGGAQVDFGHVAGDLREAISWTRSSSDADLRERRLRSERCQSLMCSREQNCCCCAATGLCTQGAVATCGGRGSSVPTVALGAGS